MKKLVIIFLMMSIVLFSLSACNSGGKVESVTSKEQMEFSEFQWPDTEIAKLMPVPKSNIGNINWSKDYGFVIYVAETSQEDYDSYVKECEDRGFTLNCRKGEDFFYADNAEGYHVSLNYQEGDVMFVRIDDPKEVEPTESPIPTVTPEPTTKPTIAPSESPTAAPTENPIDTDSSQIISEPDPTPTITPSPTEEPSGSSTSYSDSENRSLAVRAFQNYGDYICPYGIKYHWFDSNISEYEGNGVWHFKVGVTVTNKYGTTLDGVAEGRVDLIGEEVTEFELLDDWE